MTKYNHAEAFCLMLYTCKDCGFIEVLWNSRDGVTPFIINCRNCKGEAMHQEMALDVRMPNYKPGLGQRIFIDVTKEKAEEYAKKRMDSFKNTEYEVPETSTRYKEVLQGVIDQMFHNGEAPDIKVV